MPYFIKKEHFTLPLIKHGKANPKEAYAKKNKSLSSFPNRRQGAL